MSLTNRIDAVVEGRQNAEDSRRTLTALYQAIQVYRNGINLNNVGSISPAEAEDMACLYTLASSIVNRESAGSENEAKNERATLLDEASLWSEFAKAIRAVDDARDILSKS